MLPTFIIDFDSTFVTVEALDRLAGIALRGHKNGDKITQEITDLTVAGMEGRLDFQTSLAKRLTLFKPTQKAINELIDFLQAHISPSAIRNKKFFQDNHQNIYIISGGFKDYIVPVVKEFGISEDHVLANTFVYGTRGNVTGLDTSNPLSRTYGKAKAVDSLKLPGRICVIGDGITDYQIKEQGNADIFYAFTENVIRKGVVAKADKVIKNFDELLFMLDLPRAQSYPTSKMKILLLENISQNAVELLTREGYSVELRKNALSEQELEAIIPEISILGIRSKTEITPRVLASAKKLLAIGAYCIGTNQIDLSEAARKSIAVFNAPYSNTRSVVELILGEIIMLYRNVPDKTMALHQGKWEKSATGSFEVRGKKLGIIGYGNIGTQLSVLAENIGMQVYFYDVVDKLALGNAKKCETLTELLTTCDVITVHVDGAKTNKNLIGEKEFQLMKQGAFFLNASRGHVVDIEALAYAIKQGKIAGAAVDVFPTEPKDNSEPFHSPLQGLHNVILTPHIGGSTEEAQANIGEFVSHKLIQYINTGNTTLSANFPNMTLSAHKDAHRLIHIHKNIPGMLAQINTVLAQEKVNIEGQYLKTNDEIGYVLTDINKHYSGDVISALKKIPGTIKVRALY